MLSKRLKNIRKDKGLTQEELAKRVKTTKGTISNYENGYSTPSNEMLSDLADALDTTTDFLLGRTDNANNNLGTINEFNDPDLQIAFKEASDFSEEARKQAIDFIRYLKEKEEREKKQSKDKRKNF
ncbi:helix-turn-helix transcriptional regulator [Bacillus haynesii]|uniref:helix-turn-helix domain-containing protein n=1 Tax=Bacillus haynesii TaxID=1925021 RepID=UPI0022810419|nr:helix-turn-helix transcriptional regulator [Bacillus haynesii]MCY8144343.1 helix-turn-helix domain-containing protein [Bacillus haynesii]MEC1455365.1 helix-turn-helix transcriptional regulator [Bacillus haynesii]MEC1571353.1 helix-turn-helix transcriptional regulator [Bacillus haynesii]